MKSRYVCKRCGLAVGLWSKGAGDFWKHHGNHYTRSCRKPPKVALRSDYEAEQARIEQECEEIIAAIYSPLK